MTIPHPLRGTLGVGDDGTFGIRFERFLGHAPDRVWAWLTEEDLRERWLPGCVIEARVGGAVRFDFGAEGVATGVVAAFHVPGRNGPDGFLEHGWYWEGVPESVVRWTLEGVDGGTHLTLTHRELRPEPAADFATGWHVMLDALALGVDGRPTGQAWAAMAEVAELYASPGGEPSEPAVQASER
ncbi:SRPBCC domain-containing protein [Nocardiopsis sp. NPDC055551]